MKAFSVIALLVAGLGCCASAQRSGSHGTSGRSGSSFSGSSFSRPSFSRPSFSGSSFSGGFNAPARHSFAAAPSYGQGRSFNIAPRYQVRGSGNSLAARNYSPARAYRRPYVPPARGRRIFYVRPGFNAWAGPNLLGYPYSGGYDDAVDQPDSVEGYDEQATPEQTTPEQATPDQEMPAPPAPYPSAYDAAPSPISGREDALTLIFKDGRPPEQIHNYALTRTVIYVRDEHPHDIFLEQVDIAATQKANRDAGVNFTLPENSR